MKRTLLIPSLENVLRLFAIRLNDFKGESKRSYRKAFSSFQVYVISNFQLSDSFTSSIIENWIINNIIQGLSIKTVGFYLDKLSSVYTKVGHRFEGGKTPIFKEIKKNLKNFNDTSNYTNLTSVYSEKLQSIYKNRTSPRKNIIIESILNYPVSPKENVNESISFLWACLALNAGIPATQVKGVLGFTPDKLKILNLCKSDQLTISEKKIIIKKVAQSLKEEEKRWFAMKLRPKVKYENLIERFGIISIENTIPELFYPQEEIARMVGRKIIWKGKPVIRDVVFFKTRKSEIYPLFTKIYDLAWCYRTPGEGQGNYASIPDKAMNDFRNALGILSPDFEVTGIGEMELRPGDEVVIVTGDYAQERAKIIKASSDSDNVNKIFRVSLLNSNGHWDIGIDARLLKKV